MDTQTTGIYLTLIASLFFLTLLLVLFILSLHKHQQQRLNDYRKQVEREIELIDRERERISADLHDELGSGLATIGLLIRYAQESGNQDTLEKAIIHLEKQHQKIKEISNNFVPRILETHGLQIALNDLLEEIRVAGKIHVNINRKINDKNYLPAKSVHIFRIFREILTNVIKHAGADMIKIDYHQNLKRILIVIVDNGKGFDIRKAKEESAGKGLHNIQSRAELLNATLFLHSDIGIGTTYSIRIPITSIYDDEWKTPIKQRS